MPWKYAGGWKCSSTHSQVTAASPRGKSCRYPLTKRLWAPQPDWLLGLITFWVYLSDNTTIIIACTVIGKACGVMWSWPISRYYSGTLVNGTIIILKATGTRPRVEPGTPKVQSWSTPPCQTSCHSECDVTVFYCRNSIYSSGRKAGFQNVFMLQNSAS